MSPVGVIMWLFVSAVTVDVCAVRVCLCDI